jgi:hypothetical protein
MLAFTCTFCDFVACSATLHPIPLIHYRGILDFIESPMIGQAYLLRTLSKGFDDYTVIYIVARKFGQKSFRIFEF